VQLQPPVQVNRPWRSCHEAPIQPVTRPNRSSATRCHRRLPGWISSHWRAAPLGRTEKCRLVLRLRAATFQAYLHVVEVEETMQTAGGGVIRLPLR
jgi:predicted component of type VI protein secretion system